MLNQLFTSAIFASASYAVQLQASAQDDDDWPNSVEEVESDWNEFIAIYDYNDDGKASYDEYKAYLADEEEKSTRATFDW